MRRVVVTGLGMVTPLGCGVEPTWQRLLAAESGVKRIEKFEVADITSRIAGQIPRGDGSNGTFNPDQWMEPKEQRKVDDFILYAMCAATQALDDADWHPRQYEDQITSGVLIGSGIGGVEGIAETAIVLRDRGPRRVSPFFIPGRIINLASGYVSIAHALKGPNHAVVTACSTGAHAIGDAGRLIALGDADVMVAGGTESPVNRISLAGFAACRALVDRIQRYARARFAALRSRPRRISCWARVPAPWCSKSTSMRSGAAPASTPSSPATDCPATPTTSPRRRKTATARYRCMKAAMRRAGISPEQIDYINAHGTSTPLGDEIELKAVERRRWQCGGPHRHVVDQILDRPFARRGRSGRSDLLSARDTRSGCAADDQSR